MALPLLLLAPISAFIGGIVSKLFDGLITLFTKKFLIHAALIAFFVGMYAVFMSGITALFSSLDFSTIPPVLVTGFSVLPSNTDNCIAVIISAKLIVLAYKVQLNILNIRKA